jgi:hypothetical protein
VLGIRITGSLSWWCWVVVLGGSIALLTSPVYSCTLWGMSVEPCTVEIWDARFLYNGSLTVNVSRRDKLGEWVNFDAFTFSDKPASKDEVVKQVQKWYLYACGADHRYNLVNPTREQLLYGS